MKVTLQPVNQHNRELLQNWLRQPQAQFLFKIIQAEIVSHKQTALQHLLSRHPTSDKDALDEAEEVLFWERMSEVLTQITENDSYPINTIQKIEAE